MKNIFLNYIKIKTIKQKMLFIFLSAVIPLLFVGIFLSQNIRSNIIEAKDHDAEVELHRMEIELENQLNTLIQISNWIYMDPQLSDLVLTQYKNPSQLIASYRSFLSFDNYLNYYPALANIRFFIENQTMLSNSNFVYASNEIKQTPWFQEAIENQSLVQWLYIQDPVVKEKVLALVRSVKNEEGTLLGVLTLFVNSSVLRNILDSSSFQTNLLLNEEVIPIEKWVKEQEKSLKNNEKFTESTINNSSAEENTVPLNKQETILTADLNLPQSVLDTFKINLLLNKKQILADINQTMFKSYAIITIVFSLVLIMIILFTRRFNHRILLLQHGMDAVAKGDFNIKKNISGQDEISDIYSTLYKTMESLRTLLDESYQHQIQQQSWQLMQKESEFKLLASQIKPHFLYNTLEMIRMNAVINRDLEVAQSVQLLSQLLRRSLNTNQTKIVSLREALDFIRIYLEIQKIRFGDRLEYMIHSTIDEDHTYLLPLLLQPIIENAFVHGIETRSENAILAVHILDIPDGLLLRVVDNGMGMSSGKLKQVQKESRDQKTSSQHIGLNNIEQRIRDFYGEDFGIHIFSMEEIGTIVDVLIPKITEGERK